MRGGRNMGERGARTGEGDSVQTLRSRYSPDPEQDLHAGVRETHSTSTYRYRCQAQQAAGG